MARPSKSEKIDYSNVHDLTHGLLERALCPPGHTFVLLRDSEKRGLRLRLSKAGSKRWQFETRIKGKLFTRALGEWPTVSLDQARIEAHRLRGLTETKQDPREIERQAQTEADERLRLKSNAKAAELVRQKAEALTVGEVWKEYMERRRPYWGDLHYRDHVDKSKMGGVPSGRRGDGSKPTQPGPLAVLMAIPLAKLDQSAIEAWAVVEGVTRASSARLAWRLLTVFLNWCTEQPEYSALMPPKNPAKSKSVREALGKSNAKRDVLQRGQLAAWFSAVQQLPSPIASACIQTMLLTGARPGEVMALKWSDINLKWKGIHIRDKVEGSREIPATPYVLHLLSSLPRRNEWIFSSPTSKSGCLAKPNTPHSRACQAAGIEGLTLHGLRRSFKSLTEWLEVPVGVVAQIQGHKPSATAEKHYTVRPLELLAAHHQRIESWMLEQAGVIFSAETSQQSVRKIA